MIIDTSTAVRLAAGSGRNQDWIWPDPLALLTTASSVPNMRQRLSGTTAAVTQGTFGSGGNSGSLFNAYVLGAPCLTIAASNNNDGQGYVCYTPNVTARPILVKGNAIPASANDHGAASFVANISYLTNVVPNLIDNGFQVLPLNGSGMQPAGGTGGAGFAFNLSAPSVIELITRVNTASAVVRTALTAAPFDPTQYHSYRFDISSATVNTEAQLYVYIDGVLMTQLAWGAGTRLPVYSGSGYGFMPLLFSLSQGQQLRLHSLRLITAPTLLDLY